MAVEVDVLVAVANAVVAVIEVVAGDAAVVMMVDVVAVRVQNVALSRCMKNRKSWMFTKRKLKTASVMKRLKKQRHDDHRLVDADVDEVVADHETVDPVIVVLETVVQQTVVTSIAMNARWKRTWTMKSYQKPHHVAAHAAKKAVADDLDVPHLATLDRAGHVRTLMNWIWKKAIPHRELIQSTLTCRLGQTS